MDEDYKKFLDAYFPLIESCIEVQAWYLGRLDGTPKIAPDVVGKMIDNLIKARQTINIQRVEDNDKTS